MSDFDIKFVKCHLEAQIPVRAYETDAGFDLTSTEFCEILPLHRKLVGTGLQIQIPKGYYGRIASRSGLASKSGIEVGAGVIDSGYKNEVKVLLFNRNFLLDDLRDFIQPSAFTSIFGKAGRFLVQPGMKIAQIIFERCYSANFIETNRLDDSERDMKGFGSSGT